MGKTFECNSRTNRIPRVQCLSLSRVGLCVIDCCSSGVQIPVACRSNFVGVHASRTERSWPRCSPKVANQHQQLWAYISETGQTSDLCWTVRRVVVSSTLDGRFIPRLRFPGKSRRRSSPRRLVLALPVYALIPQRDFGKVDVSSLFPTMRRHADIVVLYQSHLRSFSVQNGEGSGL